jgi:cytochrome c biogenesis protein
VPADDQGEMTGFMRLRGRWRTRCCASRRCAATPRARPTPRGPSWPAAVGVGVAGLALFAGAEPGRNGKTTGGLQAISDFMETNVPEAERARAGEVLMRILNGVLFELTQLAREQPG